MNIGAMLIDGGFADYVVCITSSHFCSAEKQFRFPWSLGLKGRQLPNGLLLGGGCFFIRRTGPFITHATTGKIVDMVSKMQTTWVRPGTSAVDTLIAHFRDTGFLPEDYDLIVTGDLGYVGKNICRN